MLLFLVISILIQLFTNVNGNSLNENNDVNLEHSTEIQGIWQLEQPFGVELRPIYKDTHAYRDFKERMPSILIKTIDSIKRNGKEIANRYGDGSLEELQDFMKSIDVLKNEIETNQLLKKLPLANNEYDRDASMWNNHLDRRKEIEGSNLSWFFTKFLLGGSYPYRIISQTLALTKKLKNFDPFEIQKQNGFTDSIESMILLAQHTMKLLNRTTETSSEDQSSELIQLLKLSLWSNRFDLSTSGGKAVKFEGNPVELVNSFEHDLFIDDSRIVFDILNNTNEANKSVIVDIVLDNAGYELFTDLCLASFLIDNHIANKVRFHVKDIPWFVSDVNQHDFLWMIDYMRNSSNPEMKHFGDLCAMRLQDNSWSIESDPFWTTFYHFGDMKKQAPALYDKLSESTLVIFKGDFNYRKLMADINWENDKTLDAVLFQLNFLPSNVVTLRTIKSQVCVGLNPDNVRLWRKDKKLMEQGQYGVIDVAVYAPACISPDNN